MNCLVLAALLLFQRTPGQRPEPKPQKASSAAVATFTGKLKAVDKKFLLLEVDDGQTMRMYVTGSTKFIRDGEPAKAADFQRDENVTVDAMRDARLNMVAVRVEMAPAKTPRPRQEN